MLVPPLSSTSNVAAPPSATFAVCVPSAAVNASSSAIVPVALAVPRLTPVTPLTDVSVSVYVSSASLKLSSSVVTSIVLLVCPVVNSSVPLAVV